MGGEERWEERDRREREKKRDVIGHRRAKRGEK